METKKYEFAPAEVYRLVGVTDREGKDKSRSCELYSGVAGCVATNLRYDGARMRLDFVQDETGLWINRSIHTSTVEDVQATEEGVTIYTRNSVYRFEKAELKARPVCDEANILELYMSSEERFKFAKGFYRDSEGVAKEIFPHIHVGMFMDSVLLREPQTGAYLARYFDRPGTVELYDTIYHQQPYDIPMLIHNTSRKYPLKIRFERCNREWTIASGGNKRIIPFDPSGADEIKSRRDRHEDAPKAE